MIFFKDSLKSICKWNFIPGLILVIVCLSCSISGSVTTEQSDDFRPIVDQPKNFLSPLTEMDDIYSKLQNIEATLPTKGLLYNPNWIQYLEFYDTLTRLETDQDAVEEELKRTGELVLQPGRSYSFDLESFCVYAGKSRPVRGDGFKLAKVKGPALHWLPEIVKEYVSKNISQEDAQTIIWALLLEVRFDELSIRDQENLLKIFPDARLKFGNTVIESAPQSVIDKIMPAQVSDLIGRAVELKEMFLKYQSDVRELSETMAPLSESKKPIPVGWIQSEEGYYIHVTEKSGYSQIHVDIYVPDDSGLTRSPSSSLASMIAGQVKKMVFRPWEWIALPFDGQRLSISSNPIPRKYPKLDPCNELKKWRPLKCAEMSDQKRVEVLNFAHPANFPRTRYVSPPKQRTPIEIETDCSHFVREIYHRAGFDFHYSPTKTFACLQVFKEVDKGDVNVGDLALFKGHVGIVGSDGKIISSTKGFKDGRNLSQLEPEHPRFVPSITSYPASYFGKPKYLKWRCR